MAPTTNSTESSTINNLTQLIPSTTSSVIKLPTIESIVQLLILRSKLEITSTFIGDTNLLVINPNSILSIDNDLSKSEYEERSYKLASNSGSNSGVVGSDNVILPHAYDLACRVYLMMRRTGETQSIIFR